MDLTGKHVVVTGATAGIGRSSAITLAGLGADLTLLSRNTEKAEALASEIVSAGQATHSDLHGHGGAGQRA